MPKPVLALDYLDSPGRFAVRPVCVSVGKDSFLQSQVASLLVSKVLQGDDSEFSLTRFDGTTVSSSDANKCSDMFAQVRREVSTVAMFGGDTRLVQVVDADAFISGNLRSLEEYVAKPSSAGILFLQAGEFSAASRFYQAVLDHGLLIDCRADSAPAERIPNWLVNWGQKQVGMNLSLAAAEIVFDLVGYNLGMLDQELRKLAVSVDQDKPISPEDVRGCVGNWRTRQVWDMIDATFAGQVPSALAQLDKLMLLPDASAIGILGAMSASLRKFAVATQLFIEAEKASRTHRVNMPDILAKAGFNRYYMQKSEEQMYKLGRRRGLMIPELLLRADADLKGASRSDPRLIIERLIVELAHPKCR